MGKVKYLIWAIFALFLVILGTQKTEAADSPPSQEVIINELMWMGSSKSDADEWVELYNMTDQRVDLSGWKIGYLDSNGTEKFLDGLNGKVIKPNDYFLISHFAKSGNTILDINPDLVLSGLMLSNSKLRIKLYDDLNNLIDIAGNGGIPLIGTSANKVSMERNEVPGDGILKENWHLATLALNLIDMIPDKATPERSFNQNPNIIKLNTPLDDDDFVEGSNIAFSWMMSDSDGDVINSQIIFDCNGTFKDDLLEKNNIESSNFVLDSKEIVNELGICTRYYWMLTVSDGDLQDIGDILSFTLSKPVYSDKIIINELLPHPENGTENEFIELYNNGDKEVDLSGWSLDDGEEVNSYPIPAGTKIAHGKYKVFYKSQTKITLNDTGDETRLLFPNGQIASSCVYDEYAAIGLSWARVANDTWAWTTIPTFERENQINAPVEATDNATADEGEQDIPINTVPIEIKTGEASNYENYLVKVTGTIISTSGNTFYLDDGSGKIKIYIQAATEIDKPKMYTGDIFEITGIVNLYRDVWRILPQKQDDIKLIKAKKEEEQAADPIVKAASTKTTTAKKSTASTTTAKARAPTTKKVAGNTSNATSGNQNTQIEGYKSPLWIEVTKAITGLMVVFLLILIVKLWKIKKSGNYEKPIGGDFGNDYT